MTDDRRQRARALLAAALEAVEAEQAAPRHALPPEQLATCRSTLREYLAALDRDALPPRRDRPEALGRLIVDAWPYDLPLGEVILRAERAWRNA